MMRSSLLALIVLAAATAMPSSGCLEASQEAVDYEAVAVPRGNGTAVAGEWSIALSRAEVALGPFYFCAAASGSSTLCESAIAEIRAVAVVNALAAPALIGRVRGFSGRIQSVSFDFGISWFKTQTNAAPAPPLPGGHSIRLAGEARKGASLRVPFTADVDVVPQFQGQNAISTAPATADVQSSATRLEIVFDPASWLRQIDFDAMAAALASTAAAAAPGTAAAPYAIVPGTPEHGAILVGIKNLSPLELRWIPAVH